MNPRDTAWTHEQQSLIRKLRTSYFGVPLKKMPLDLWIFQEIITERKPEVIVEIGNLYGGSTLFLAHLLDQIHGEDKEPIVVACDISREHYRAPVHARIMFVTGDIASDEAKAEIKKLVGSKTCMIIHDAQHTAIAVWRDLQALSPLVTKGQYFIVEDGIIDVWQPARQGPLKAIDQFLRDNSKFRPDKSRERYGVTWNPNGYLERVQ